MLKIKIIDLKRIVFFMMVWTFFTLNSRYFITLKPQNLR